MIMHVISVMISLIQYVLRCSCITAASRCQNTRWRLLQINPLPGPWPAAEGAGERRGARAAPVLEPVLPVPPASSPSQAWGSAWQSVPGGEGQVFRLEAVVDSCCEGDDVRAEVAVGGRKLDGDDCEG